MSDDSFIKKLADIENLRRAWKWICSSRDAAYKSYFRRLYGAYARGGEHFLCEIAKRLKAQATGYSAKPARKIFLPKPNGLLRTYSLLTVENQIVYQAAVNLIAERFHKKFGKHYYKRSFGHLYAEEGGTWFYQNWPRGYYCCKEKVQQAIKEGNRYCLSFDFTAFYDSIDHRVLAKFLTDLGFSQQFAGFLTNRLLAAWSKPDNDRISLSRGIPQGPLSSGLLAEVVLNYFDNSIGGRDGIVYVRYVDDIKVLAKDKEILREILVEIDKKSKEIGVFPQGSKIKIEKVSTANDVMKFISYFPGHRKTRKSPNQKRLFAQIKNLTRRFKIADSTKFKRALASANPCYALTQRLWNIYEKNEDAKISHYNTFCRYLSGYPEFPQKVAEKVIAEIRRRNPRQTITAEFIRTAIGRIPKKLAQDANNAVHAQKKGWKGDKNIDPDLFAAILEWRAIQNKRAPGEIPPRDKRCWEWTQAILAVQNELSLGNENWKRTLKSDSWKRFLDSAIRSGKDDVAVAAACISLPSNKPNRMASIILKATGLACTVPTICYIHVALKEMLGDSIAAVDWKTLFGKREYKHALMQINFCKGYYPTDATAWVNTFDVFNDHILDSLHRRCPEINNPSKLSYETGYMGSSMHSKLLKKHFPAVQEMAVEIHNKRVGNKISHRRVKKTQKPTEIIRFGYRNRAKKKILPAVAELAERWPGQS